MVIRVVMTLEYTLVNSKDKAEKAETTGCVHTASCSSCDTIYVRETGGKLASLAKWRKKRLRHKSVTNSSETKVIENRLWSMIRLICLLKVRPIRVRQIVFFTLHHILPTDLSNSKKLANFVHSSDEFLVNCDSLGAVIFIHVEEFLCKKPPKNRVSELESKPFHEC